MFDLLKFLFGKEEKEYIHRPNLNHQKVGYIRAKRWETPLTPEQEQYLDELFGKGDYE